MLSFFPRDVLDEIWNLIESVSEGFLSYSISIINFESFFFQNFIEDIMNGFLNSRSVQNLSCNRAYRNKYVMVTWSIIKKNVSRADFF